MNPRIIPLNLPARMAEEIEGNPVISRLESAIANCYPGLEIDIRNLDRRFFPGLIFNFVTNLDENGNPDLGAPTGAQLVAVDINDPIAPFNPHLGQNITPLRSQIGVLGDLLKAGKTILLDSLAVGSTKLEFRYESGLSFDWDVAWRMIRSLKEEPIEIQLRSWPNMESPFPMTLTGKRRQFQTKDGKLADVYKAGEMTQSLCSPWQHDFRDCDCSYWASNHPDIVLPAHPANIKEAEEPGSKEDQADDPILWMRWKESQESAARPTGTRHLLMDHYEINETWKELPIVLENREIDEVYCRAAAASPVPSKLDEDLLTEKLIHLAGVEQALALEYLYARYSVNVDVDVDDTQLSLDELDEKQHAEFIARELLVIAISEMTHLRWVNLLLRKLHEKAERKDAFRPSVHVARSIPPNNRPARSQTLQEAIEKFIDAEKPSGSVDGQYAKILDFFVEEKYPGEFIGLVKKIINDGVDHYSRFREMEDLLRRHPGRLVRKLETLPLDDQRYKNATRIYKSIITALGSTFAKSDGPATAAHSKMRALDKIMAELAKTGIGVPLIEIAIHLEASHDTEQD